MSEIQKEDASQLERQWLLLEEHYKNDKPIAARILEIAKGRVLVNVGGVQGHIESFVYAFTEHSTIEATKEMPPLTEQRMQQRLMELVGKEILLGIVEMDQKSQYLKLSQKLYREHKKSIDEFEIGRISAITHILRQGLFY